MSKHLFQHGPLHIETGWDQPLRSFYLNVTRPAAPNEEDRSVYRSLDDPTLKRGRLTEDDLRARFTILGITPPLGLMAALNADAQRGRMNTLTRWIHGVPRRD